MDFTQYIKPEMLVLVPVLWLIGAALKRTPKMSDWLIPYILGAAGIIMAGIWVGSEEGVTLVSLFTAFTQGILVAGASVWSHQLVKQTRKKNADKEE